MHSPDSYSHVNGYCQLSPKVIVMLSHKPNLHCKWVLEHALLFVGFLMDSGIQEIRTLLLWIQS